MSFHAYTLKELQKNQQLTTVIPGVLYFAALPLQPPTARDVVNEMHWRAAEASRQQQRTRDALALQQRYAITAFPGRAPVEMPPLEPPKERATRQQAVGLSHLSPSLQSLYLSLAEQLCESNSVEKEEPRDPAAVGSSSGIGCAMTEEAFYFSISQDPAFQYPSIFEDFGPLDVGCIVHFCRLLSRLLHHLHQWVWEDPPGLQLYASLNENHFQWPREVDKDELLRLTTHPQYTPPRLRPSPLPSVIHLRPPIVFCCGLERRELTNAATLLGCFCVSVLGWSPVRCESSLLSLSHPKDASSKPTSGYGQLLDFRDASVGAGSYPLRFKDVLCAVEKSVQLGWLNVVYFNLERYGQGVQRQYAWVVPYKLLTLQAPSEKDPERGAHECAEWLHKLGVTLVVGLNPMRYSPTPFHRRSIRLRACEVAEATPLDKKVIEFLAMLEEEFGERISGSAAVGTGNASLHVGGALKGLPPALTKVPMPSKPSARIKSTEPVGPKAQTRPSSQAKRRSPPHHVCERTQPRSKNDQACVGCVAVHCPSGIGRSATLCGVYLMRHYHFSAREAIAWLRLCRPGSVAGVQQQYLDMMERRLGLSAQVPRKAPALLRQGNHAASSSDEEKLFARLGAPTFSYQPHGEVLDEPAAFQPSLRQLVKPGEHFPDFFEGSSLRPHAAAGSLEARPATSGPLVFSNTVPSSLSRENRPTTSTYDVVMPPDFYGRLEHPSSFLLALEVARPTSGGRRRPSSSPGLPMTTSSSTSGCLSPQAAVEAIANAGVDYCPSPTQGHTLTRRQVLGARYQQVRQRALQQAHGRTSPDLGASSLPYFSPSALTAEGPMSPSASMDYASLIAPASPLHCHRGRTECMSPKTSHGFGGGPLSPSRRLGDSGPPPEELVPLNGTALRLSRSGQPISRRGNWSEGPLRLGRRSPDSSDDSVCRLSSQGGAGRLTPQSSLRPSSHRTSGSGQRVDSPPLPSGDGDQVVGGSTASPPRDAVVRSNRGLTLQPRDLGLASISPPIQLVAPAPAAESHFFSVDSLHGGALSVLTPNADGARARELEGSFRGGNSEHGNSERSALVELAKAEWGMSPGWGCRQR